MERNENILKRQQDNEKDEDEAQDFNIISNKLKNLPDIQSS